MAISIIDIAKAANVSHMTVSRVLNGNPRVRPENVKAVLAAAERLGYVAPLRKRGPKPNGPRGPAKKVRKFLLVIPSLPSESLDPNRLFLDYPFGQEVARGLIEAAQAKGIEVEVASAEPSGSLTDVDRAEGLVVALLGAPDPPKYLAELGPAVPCVTMGRCEPYQQLWDCVTADNDAMSEIAAEQLMACGARTLALVTPLPDRHVVRERARAFRKAAQRRGAGGNYFVGPRMTHANGPDEELVIDPSPKALVDQILDLPYTPDGLFMVGDMSFEEIYREFRSRGIEPVRKNPRPDRSFIAITPSRLRLWLEPVKPMPYIVGVDGTTIGEHLSDLLLRRIARPDDATTHVLVAPRLLA
ncbi:MAG: LacI family DNA-binding transcriptional regulator [Planctomycetota bacterium]|jgi:LacI family transcriptional regulator